MNPQRTKKRNGLLLALLAKESTEGACNILKNHGKPKPTDHSDLEDKLADLYFNDSSANKEELEVEFANIHPHKNWIIKRLDLAPRAEIKKAAEELAIKQTPALTKDDVRLAALEAASSFSGKNSGACSCGGDSNFNGSGSGRFRDVDGQRFTINVIALVAVIGLTYHFLKR